MDDSKRKNENRNKDGLKETVVGNNTVFKCKRYNCDSLSHRDCWRIDQMKPSKFQHSLHRESSNPFLPPPLPFFRLYLILMPSATIPLCLSYISLWTGPRSRGGYKTLVSETRGAGAGDGGGDDAKSARANGLALEQPKRCTVAGSRLGVAPGAPSTSHWK